jgi:hypothetical protein
MSVLTILRGWLKPRVLKSKYSTDLKVGDVIKGTQGNWRVACESGPTPGLEPVGLRHRLYWWWRLRKVGR